MMRVRVPESVPGGYSTLVNGIGMNQFPHVFAGARHNEDGSVTVYMGPGDTTPLMTAIRDADLTRVAGLSRSSSGEVTKVPEVHLVRVPVALAALAAASEQMVQRHGDFAAAGFPASSWGPNPEAGTLDIRLSNFPDGGKEAATSYFHKHLSPLARVVDLGVRIAW